MKSIIKKFITLIITLFFISFLTFFAFQFIPGDSILISLGASATQSELDQRREEMGYNENVLIQYGRWLSRLVRGDMGQSSQYHMPVKTLVENRFLVTIGLGMLAILFILIFSIPIGILTSRKEKRKRGFGIAVWNQIAMAVPPFFLGMMILLFFGLILKWFTPGSYVSPKESFFGYLRFMIFPAAAIAIPKIAMTIKFLKSSIDRQLSQDYVRTAKSKGIHHTRILYHHVLKNAMIPVITFLGMIFSDVLAGSMVIEQVFNLPGIGRLLVVSISNRDYYVVQVIVLYIAVLVITINFLVDLAYQWLDPRIRPA